jgi:hypothetical protein
MPPHLRDKSPKERDQARTKTYIRRGETQLLEAKNSLEFLFLFLEAVASVLWRVGKPSSSVEFRWGLVLILAQLLTDLPLFCLLFLAKTIATAIKEELSSNSGHLKGGQTLYQ